MTSTITGALRERVGNEPDVAFVRCGDATDWLTFRDIDTRSRRIAAGLRSAGVAQGDRVATILPNVPAAIDLVFALARLGAIEVAINVFAKGEFLRHQLVDSDPRVLIVDRPGLAVARPFLDQCSVALLVLVGTAETAALFAGSVISYDSITETEATDFVDASVTSADIAAISYTSGTTGPAKGCLLSHGYYTSIGGAYAQRNVFHAGDCVLSAMPCYHLGAVSLIMSALTVGFRVRLEQRFSASGFMAAAQSDRATVIWGTGTMGAAILAQPESSHDFMSPVERALFVPMRTADQEEFELRFRCRLIGSYGQEELRSAR